MEECVRIGVGTVAMRPYVFAFFAAYLAAAVPHLGWRKIMYFTVVGYLISFLSEFSSINTGIPYGWYYYLDGTCDRELWIAGVPFFDSLSYVFLAYCSYATALFVVSPLKAWRWDLVTLETRSFRRSFAVLFLGSLFQVFLDIIIDPVALQGHRWFLGQIYGYREVGIHFGVPLSNYLGWWLVSFLLVFALQRIDSLAGGTGGKPAGVANLPLRSLYGPVLYLSVIVFNLSVTLWIGERLMALTGIFIYVLPVAIVVVTVIRRTNRYRKEEMAEHLRDFPWSAAAMRRS
ncbi:MAG: carotenoid biosynthesis protein [Desulfuromonadales bacterium]|nr:MAG: carotenoid biosynthesis protein [Desulfuromonadales bacterium]